MEVALVSAIGRAVQDVQVCMKRQGLLRLFQATPIRKWRALGSRAPFSYPAELLAARRRHRDASVAGAALIRHGAMPLDTVPVKLNVPPSLRREDGAVFVIPKDHVLAQSLVQHR